MRDSVGHSRPERVKTKRRSGLALAISAALAAGAVATSVPVAAQPAQTYEFAFADAEIAAIADEVLGQALGLSYTVDPAVSGRLSFRIDQRLTPDQLLSAFEAALGSADVVLVRDGAQLRLVPRSRARSAASVRARNAPSRGGYELVAAPLAFATPTEVKAAFDAIGSGSVIVHTDDRLGLIVLGGNSRELLQAFEVLRLLDQSSLADSRIRWFELRNASAPTLARELESVLQAGRLSSVTVVPLRRLNGVVVFARTGEALQEVATWVDKLDVPTREEASSLWVYRPRNLRAENLAQTLNSALGAAPQTTTVVTEAAEARPSGTSSDPAPATAAQPTTAVISTVSQDGVRIGVDRDSNSILVVAPASRWTQIQRILDQIDRTPDQVLIEASILEVTLGDEFRLGVDWSILNGSGLTVASSNNNSGAVTGRFPGFSITYFDSDVRAAINALGSRTNVEVVSAPKIMALDNRTSSLQVGDQVPVAVQASRSTSDPDAPLVVTTEYRDTGVILRVTPRVNGEDRILLEVSQEVSSVARTTTSGIDSPTIQQRKLDSSLILRDGGTVALGGLISSSRSFGRAGVPVLKEAPLIGALFRSENTDNRRTELIVLLTAQIVRTDEKAAEAIEDLLAGMREIKNRGLVQQR